MAHTPASPLGPAARGRDRGGRESENAHVVLDGMSKQIVEQLQQDGRRSYAAIGKVVGEDDDHLLEILGRVRSIPSVTTTETFVYLKLRKQTYSWGTR